MKRGSFSVRNFIGEVSLSLVLLLAFNVQLSAQGASSAEILAAMRSAMGQFPAAVVSFEFVTRDGKGAVIGDYSGKVATQGIAFKMVNDEVEVFCDGSSKWILNKGAGELTILPNDTTAVDIAENPVGFIARLGSAGSGFKTPVKPKDSNGLWVIEMSPSAKRSPYKKVVVSVNKADNLPAVIEFISADESSYRIEVKEFKRVAVTDLSAFAFPKNRMQGVTVTDLR